jgi:predicted nucleotidyltransferase
MAQMEAILRALRGEMARVLGDRLEQILLFGSQARGEARPDSDIDILVVVRGECDAADLIRRTSVIIATLSLRYDVVISRAFVSQDRYEREQSPFLLNVHREGVAV